jgi:signal transduction histidine kinase
MEEISLASLLRSCAKAFTGAASKKNIWINVHVSDEAVSVKADEAQLRKALDNLCSNAIKYTPQGGSVTLSARSERGYILIEVSDTGLGMTDDDIANAFQEFNRLSAKPTGGEASTGLGLFIVKKIVELHGGAVSARSDGRDRGTTFTVTLPGRSISF